MTVLNLTGTGKTLTGIKLIILFNQINLKNREEGGDHKLVVYCGPSNKSVDLVASTFLGTYLHDILRKNKRLVSVQFILKTV